MLKKKNHWISGMLPQDALYARWRNLRAGERNSNGIPGVEHEGTSFHISPPTFWAQNVDDTFTMVRRDQVGALEKRLNSIFSDVQFTIELEKDKKFSFLDVIVTRTTNGGLTTTAYRKATTPLRMLHFSSNHPIWHKVSCLSALIYRINSHCITVDAKRTEEAHLKKMCAANGYSNDFIRQHIRRHPQPRKMTTEDQRAATADGNPWWFKN